MRQRSYFIGLWLDDNEYRYFKKQCAASGLTASAFIRKSVMGESIRPRPPDTYAALLRELSAIGNNINQLAYWANALKGTTPENVREAVARVKEAARLVKDTL